MVSLSKLDSDTELHCAEALPCRDSAGDSDGRRERDRRGLTVMVGVHIALAEAITRVMTKRDRSS